MRVQDRVATLRAGDIVEVWCTDPGALNDVPAWCRPNRHGVVEAGERGAEVMIRIEVGA